MNRRQQQSTVVTSVVAARPATARSLAAAPQQVVTTTTTTRRRRRRQRGRSNPSTQAGMVRDAASLHPDVLAYVRCLADPFAHPPVPLGFGCMTASQTTTLTARTIVSAGADGGFSAYVIPSVNLTNTGATAGGLYTSNSTAGTPLLSSLVQWQNYSAVGNLFEEARVISCGLRVTPMIPGTSAPGGAFVASLPSSGYNTLEGFTKANLIINPLFTWGMASSGATVTSRPVDPNSFTFHHDLVSGIPVANDSPVTVPCVVLNGLTAGFSILVEAVLQIEGIYGLDSESQVIQNMVATNSAPRENGITRSYPSLESLWSTVSRWIPSAATVRTAANLANALLAPDVGSGTQMVGSRTRYLPSSVSGRLLP